MTPTLLSQANKGRIVKPMLILVYGPGGIGKSTWASKATNPIFICGEQGTNHLDVTRFPVPRHYEDVRQSLMELIKEQHDFKTVVIDSIDWIEPMLHAYICKINNNARNMEVACGGYGKAYTEAFNEWLKFKALLEAVRAKGMNVILIAHPETLTVTNPQTQVQFQRYELKLHKRAKSLFMEYVDAHFFAGFEMFTRRDGSDVIAVNSQRRVLHVTWNEGYDAKNRYKLTDNIDMNLPWSEFTKLTNLEPVRTLPSIEESQFVIGQLLPQIQDEEMLAKINATIEAAGDSAATMAAIAGRLKQLVGE